MPSIPAGFSKRGRTRKVVLESGCKASEDIVKAVTQRIAFSSTSVMSRRSRATMTTYSQPTRGAPPVVERASCAGRYGKRHASFADGMSLACKGADVRNDQGIVRNREQAGAEGAKPKEFHG